MVSPKPPPTPSDVAGGSDVSPALDAAAVPTLESLMARACDGDARAFEVLFHRLAPSLYRYVLRRVRSPALAEEVTQTAMYKVWNARESFQQGARVEPWVYQIAHNAMIDALRSLRRRRERLTREGETPEPEVVMPEADALDGLDDAQRALLTACIDALPTAQREALIAMKVEGKSAREIADAQGLSVSAIKVRAFRAYQTLRAAFGQAPTLRRAGDAS